MKSIVSSNKKLMRRVRIATVILMLIGMITFSSASASSDSHAPKPELISKGDAHLDDGHETEHGDEGVHGEDFWWKFPGWEIVFAVLSCIYFLTVITLLPKAIQLKTGRREH